MSLNYHEITTCLSSLNSTFSAAEIQALFCACFCANSTVEESKAITTVLNIAEISESNLNEERFRILQTLCGQTRDQLGSALFNFQLLLPDDSQPMSLRMAALSQWAQGFVYGLGMVRGIRDWVNVPGIFETIRNLVQIARINHQGAENSEENEWDYAEIFEYLRMAVLFIHDELNFTEDEIADNRDNQPIVASMLH